MPWSHHKELKQFVYATIASSAQASEKVVLGANFPNLANVTFELRLNMVSILRIFTVSLEVTNAGYLYLHLDIYENKAEVVRNRLSEGKVQMLKIGNDTFKKKKNTPQVNESESKY